MIRRVSYKTVERRRAMEMLLGARWSPDLQCFTKKVYTQHPNGLESYWTYYYDNDGNQILTPEKFTHLR